MNLRKKTILFLIFCFVLLQSLLLVHTFLHVKINIHHTFLNKKHKHQAHRHKNDEQCKMCLVFSQIFNTILTNKIYVPTDYFYISNNIRTNYALQPTYNFYFYLKQAPPLFS
jgi:hypothetical protein